MRFFARFSRLLTAACFACVVMLPFSSFAETITYVDESNQPVTQCGTNGTQTYTASAQLCNSVTNPVLPDVDCWWWDTNNETRYFPGDTITNNTNLTLKLICPKFTLTTTSDTTEFSTWIAASGEFYIDCGNGGTFYIGDTSTGNQIGHITPQNTNQTQYKCSYTTAGEHIINYAGLATGYSTSSTLSSATSIAFYKDYTDNSSHIKSIDGFLGGIFPTLTQSTTEQLVPRFYRTFKDATHLTTIPGRLFVDANGNGVSGHTAYMFGDTFMGCTGLTGPDAIPPRLFVNENGAGVSDAADHMFDATFHSCTGLKSIPEHLFVNENGAGVSGAAGFMFANTFLNCTGLTEIPEHLFVNENGDGVSGAAGGMFGATFQNCTGLTEIPSGLFSDITGEVESNTFSFMFLGCTNLKKFNPSTVADPDAPDYIPTGFFNTNLINTNNIDATSNMFSGTQFLTSCPSDTYLHYDPDWLNASNLNNKAMCAECPVAAPKSDSNSTDVSQCYTLNTIACSVQNPYIYGHGSAVYQNQSAQCRQYLNSNDCVLVDETACDIDHLSCDEGYYAASAGFYMSNNISKIRSIPLCKPAGTNDDCEYYDLDNGEWLVYFTNDADLDFVNGFVTCNSVEPTSGWRADPEKRLKDASEFPADPRNSTGVHCWSRGTSFKAKDAQNITYIEPKYFYIQEYDYAEDCLNNCGYNIKTNEDVYNIYYAGASTLDENMCVSKTCGYGYEWDDDINGCKQKECPAGYTSGGELIDSPYECYVDWECPANPVCPDNSSNCVYTGETSGRDYYGDRIVSHCVTSFNCNAGYHSVPILDTLDLSEWDLEYYDWEMCTLAETGECSTHKRGDCTYRPYTQDRTDSFALRGTAVCNNTAGDTAARAISPEFANFSTDTTGTHCWIKVTSMENFQFDSFSSNRVNYVGIDAPWVYEREYPTPEDCAIGCIDSPDDWVGHEEFTVASVGSVNQNACVPNPQYTIRYLDENGNTLTTSNPTTWVSGINEEFTTSAPTLSEGTSFYGWSETNDFNSVDPNNKTRTINDQYILDHADANNVVTLYGMTYPTSVFTMTTVPMAPNDVFKFYTDSVYGTLYINWGDGTVQKFTLNNTTILHTHTYTQNTRTYNIGLSANITDYYYSNNEKIESDCAGHFNPTFWLGNGWDASNYNNATREKLAGISGDLSAVFPTTPNGKQPSFVMTFTNCVNLEGEIPSNMFAHITGQPRTAMFYGLFYNCPKLGTENGVSTYGIPANLFGGLNGTYADGLFSYTFYNTGLTGSLPADITDPETGQKYSGLFGKLSGTPKKCMFTNTFAGYNANDPTFICKINGNIPQHLFGNINGAPAEHMFNTTFYNCENLDGPIPENLFGNINGAPAEHMFNTTFYNCKNLDGPIPENLFGNVNGAPAEYMFQGTFCGCENLDGPIPENLFGNINGAPAIYMFNSTFYNCKNLDGPIPENLFGNVTGAPAEYMYTNTFNGCEKLGTENGVPTYSIPDRLFGTFNDAPAEYMFARTFENCSGLTGPIPEHLFAGINGNIKRGSFNKTFLNASNLTRPIPENLFENIRGTAPLGIRMTFMGATNLGKTANGESSPIPANLFQNISGTLPAVTTTDYGMFEQTFADTQYLTGPVPTELFSGVTGFLENNEEGLLQSTYVSGGMKNIFANSNIDNVCPDNYYQYLTGFESDWGNTEDSSEHHVACEQCPQNTFPNSVSGENVSITSCFTACPEDTDNGGTYVSGNKYWTSDGTGDISTCKYQYTITYDLKGANNSLVSAHPTTYYNLMTTDLEIPAPAKRSGYTFVGWHDNPNLTGETVSHISAGSVGNVTLYAEWEHDCDEGQQFDPVCGVCHLDNEYWQTNSCNYVCPNGQTWVNGQCMHNAYTIQYVDEKNQVLTTNNPTQWAYGSTQPFNLTDPELEEDWLFHGWYLGNTFASTGANEANKITQITEDIIVQNAVNGIVKIYGFKYPKPVFWLTTIPNTNMFKVYFQNNIGTLWIYWGDGSVQKFDANGGNVYITHNYVTSDVYNIRFSSRWTKYATNARSYNTVEEYEQAWHTYAPTVCSPSFSLGWRASPEKIAAIGGSLGKLFPSINNDNIPWNHRHPTLCHVLKDTTNLKTNIPNGFFDGVTGMVTSAFDGVFANSSITGNIPENLFKDIQNKKPLPDVFAGLFRNCPNLTGTIPKSLFNWLEGEIESNIFASVFENDIGLEGEIPPDLFGNLSGSAAWAFEDTFKGAIGLTGSIPPNLFSGVSGKIQESMFKGTFSGASGLTGEIPKNLFSDFTGVATNGFFETFKGATNLGKDENGNATAIPPQLFANISGDITGTQMFNGTFEDTTYLTGSVPVNLFSGVTGFLDDNDMGDQVSNTPYVSGNMSLIFNNSSVIQKCPAGQYQYLTGFEADWNGRVACKPCPSEYISDPDDPIKSNVSITSCYTDCSPDENGGTYYSGHKYYDGNDGDEASCVYQYTINYDLGGVPNAVNSNPTQYLSNMDSDLNIEPLSNQPTRNFIGWYSDDTFTTPIEKIDAGSTGNITLYAKWVSVSCPENTYLDSIEGCKSCPSAYPYSVAGTDDSAYCYNTKNVACSAKNPYLMGHGTATYTNTTVPCKDYLGVYSETWLDEHTDNMCTLDSASACGYTLACDTGYELTGSKGVLSDYIFENAIVGYSKNSDYCRLSHDSEKYTDGANMNYINTDCSSPDLPSVFNSLQSNEWRAEWMDGTAVYGTSSCQSAYPVGYIDANGDALTQGQMTPEEFLVGLANAGATVEQIDLIQTVFAKYLSGEYSLDETVLRSLRFTNVSSANYTPGAKNGNYCWCKMTGYSLRGGNNVSASGNWWNENETHYQSANECATYCARDCVIAIEQSVITRTAAFEALGDMRECSLLIYNITFQNENTTVGNDTYTYNAESQTKDVPQQIQLTKENHEFNGWCTTYNSQQYCTTGDNKNTITIPAGATGPLTYYAQWEQCGANNYYENGTCHSCSTETNGAYPYADNYSESIADCYKINTVNCSEYNPYLYGHGVAVYQNQTATCIEHQNNPYYCELTDASACRIVSLSCDTGYNSADVRFIDLGDTMIQYTCNPGCSLGDIDGCTENCTGYPKHMDQGSGHLYFESNPYHIDNVVGLYRCNTTAGDDSSAMSRINSDANFDNITTGTHCYTKMVTVNNNAIEHSWIYTGQFATEAECQRHCGFISGYKILFGEDYENSSQSYMEIMYANLYAAQVKQCVATQYTITFISNGGTEYDAMTYTINSEAITLPEPIREHHDFKGWYEDTEFTGEPISSFTPDSNNLANKIFYAQWEQCGANNYYENGTCHSCSTETNGAYPYADNYSESINDCYTDCSPDENGGTYYSGHKYYNENGGDESSCVYQYDITYELFNGYNYNDAPETYVAGIGATIDGTPTRDNSNFVGWCTDDTLRNCSDTYSISPESHEPVTLYAKWESTCPDNTIDYDNDGICHEICKPFFYWSNGVCTPYCHNAGYTYNGTICVQDGTSCPMYSLDAMDLENNDVNGWHFTGGTDYINIDYIESNGTGFDFNNNQTIDENECYLARMDIQNMSAVYGNENITNMEVFDAGVTVTLCKYNPATRNYDVSCTQKLTVCTPLELYNLEQNQKSTSYITETVGEWLELSQTDMANIDSLFLYNLADAPVYDRCNFECLPNQIKFKNTCIDTKFTLTTVPYTTSLSTWIAATGEFYIDCGAGGTFYNGSTNTGNQAGRIISRNTNQTQYKCVYQPSTERHIIKYTGLASGYNTHYDYAAISFANDWTFGASGTEASVSMNARQIAAISGSLGAIFPTLNASTTIQKVPRFNHTFTGATRLTEIPERLFVDENGNGVTGTTDFMFKGTFEGCSDLTEIPERLFINENGDGISYGDETESLFKRTFRGCINLTSIPPHLFVNENGNTVNIGKEIFAGTFFGCTGLTSIPAELFNGITGDVKDTAFYGTFTNCTNLKKFSPATIDNPDEPDYIPYGFFNRELTNDNNALSPFGKVNEYGPWYIFSNTGFATSCPANMYLNYVPSWITSTDMAQKVMCSPCPSGTVSSPGSTDFSQCRCIEGVYDTQCGKCSDACQYNQYWNSDTCQCEWNCSQGYDNSCNMCYEEETCNDDNQYWNSDTCQCEWNCSQGYDNSCNMCYEEEYCDNPDEFWNADMCMCETYPEFICESQKYLHIGDNDKICLSKTKPNSISLAIGLSDGVYYIPLSNEDVPITNDSDIKMRVLYNGTTYSAHDDSIQY